MDRREKGDALYREKFISFGLCEKFEYIRREWSLPHDKRFWSRCKACGAEFLSWNEVFKGRQSRLICSECGEASDGSCVWERSPQCAEAMVFYVEGHSVAETAERFEVSKSQVNNAVKRRGLSNGRIWSGVEENSRRSKEAEQRLIERVNLLGFDYIGGYTGKTGNITIKCRACGDVFERTASFVKNGNLVCKKCEHEKALARQAERREARKADSERLRAEKKAEREREKLKKNPLWLSDYQLKSLASLDDVAVCKVCGKKYTLREYIESTGIKNHRNSGYCSAECRSAKWKEQIKASHKDRRDSHRHRAVKYGCEYDPSVTLKRLIKRDGLRCAICGEMCDQNDHSWSKYSGPMYPSIDHIMPMAKGGPHVWENVQVAHIICNSEKGDRYEEEI